MTTPTAYARYRDYSQFQADNPDTELNGSDLDTDFDRVKTTTDSLATCLATIRKDDGALKNASVGLDQLTAAVVLLLNGVTPRGAWVTSTAYDVGDIVTQSSITYACVTAHTSGTFATDLAASKWQQLSPLTSASGVGVTPAGAISSTDVQAALEELDTEKQPKDATLTALAAVVTAANKLIYATGSDAFSTTDLTAAARALLDDADAATMLATLGAVAKAGDTMTGALTLSGNPSSALHAAPKQYIDALISSGVSHKNALINGDFEIDQRNEGSSQTFTAAASVAYTVDRWYASCTGANMTGQRVAGTSPTRYAYKFTGAASVTGVLFGQRIEAANVAHRISSDVCVSLSVKSSSLTSLTWTAYYANSADDFSSKTQIATGTITGISSTLSRQSFTFNTGSSAGNGIAIEFTAGALLATHTLQFENVQLEDGTSATGFEWREIREKLADCQRYYHKSYAVGTAIATNTANGLVGGASNDASFTGMIGVQFPVAMRASPTLAYWDRAGNASKGTLWGAGGSFTDNATINTPGGSGLNAKGFVQAGNNATAHASAMFHYTADAEL